MQQHFTNPALLVVDLQNDFVRQGAPMEVPSARDTIAVIADLAAGFRAANRPVIYIRYMPTSSHRHLSDHLTWLKTLEKPVQACLPGRMRWFDDIAAEREGFAIVDELSPQPNDIIIDKPYYSAFHETDLAQKLVDLAADSLVVTGTMTEMCVEDTARHAVHFGYPVTVVSDGVSTNDPIAHDNMLSAFASNYGWVMTGKDVQAMIANGQMPHSQ